MVGEGGNLGFTQLGRIEYALAGGLIYTDAIDNSAGVDCSDHEVNIKIALDQLVHDGELTLKQRNALLAEMTDEVAELVLDDNRDQTLALTIARHQALPMVNVHARYLDSLEAEGMLDRELEFLPTDKQIAERQSAGVGLSAPEFAVMIAYTKSADIAEILDTRPARRPGARRGPARLLPGRRCVSGSPTRCAGTGCAARSSRRRLVNSMVNLAGISFDHRMTEDTGVDRRRRAACVAWPPVGSSTRRPVGEIDALDRTVPLDTQIDLFLEARRLAERAAGWLLRHRRPPFGIDVVVDEFRTPIADHRRQRSTASSPVACAADIDERRVAFHRGGSARRTRRTGGAAGRCCTPASTSSNWRGEQGCPVEHAMTTYWSMFDALDLFWLWDGIGALPTLRPLADPGPLGAA